MVVRLTSILLFTCLRTHILIVSYTIVGCRRWVGRVGISFWFSKGYKNHMRHRHSSKHLLLFENHMVVGLTNILVFIRLPPIF